MILREQGFCPTPIDINGTLAMIFILAGTFLLVVFNAHFMHAGGCYRHRRGYFVRLPNRRLRDSCAGEQLLATSRLRVVLPGV